MQNRRSRHSLPFRRIAAAVIGALALLGSDVSAVDIDPDLISPELAQRAVPQRLLVLPDGSFLTYWTFNRFNGQNAGLILKFKKDGTLDPAFRFTGPYVHVIALTPAPDGKFIVAVRQREKTRATYPILRLNSDGSVDPDFDAGSGADRDVYGLAVQTDGKILVGGTFENFNGEARQGIVRLQPNGAMDTTFAAVTFDPDQPSSAAGIRSKIIVQPDSKILFGGSIGAVNGVARDGVARLNENGSLDSSFVPAAPRGPGSPQQVTAIELQPDGKVLVAGRYAPAGSSMISPLVRLNANGSADTYFPGRVVSGSMFRPLGRALNLRPNGDIIVAGDRLYLYSAAGTERSGSQQTTISGASFGLDTTSDGSILLAGDRTVFGDGAIGVQRFSPDGLRDSSFNVGEFQQEILPTALAPRSDGQIWLGDVLLDRVNGVPRERVARLNWNGTLNAFNPAPGEAINGFSLQADDRVVLVASNSYRRLNADDTADSSFVNDIMLPLFDTLQPDVDGRHFVMRFGAEGVLEDTVIRRVTNDGMADKSFEIGLKFSEIATTDDKYVVYVGENRPMASYPDGRFLFRYFDNSGMYRLGRFHADGSVDPTFATSSVPAIIKRESTRMVSTRLDFSQHLLIEAAPAVLSDALLLPDGKVVVTGMFEQFNGTPARGIVRLNADGSVDSTFRSGGGAEWVVTAADATHIPRVDAIERLADGKLLIAGDFEAYDSAAAPGLARLNSDGSCDTTFVSPVARQANFTTVLDLYGLATPTLLVTEPARTILLSGNYAPASGGPARSLIRLIVSGTQTQPLNISTRLNVQTGDNALIGGFIIMGNAPKKVVVRALGTSLTQSGVSGALADPTLELLGPEGAIASNDNWKESQQSEIESSGFRPQNDLESAIVRTLPPGAYTALVRGKNGGTGVGLVELYDLDQAADAKLANISTRGFVQTGDNVMIGGFILGGSGAGTNILVRALGPSLGESGVAGALQDPTLELRNSDGALVAQNDDWKNTQEAAIRATTIPPKRDAEAALLVSLPSGAYTATVRGKNNATGVGLIEVYHVQ